MSLTPSQARPLIHIASLEVAERDEQDVAVLLVATGAAKGRIEPSFGEAIEQRARLQQAATLLRAQVVRIRAIL